MELPVGALLGGRYILDEVLGRGGFATVYAARHAQLGSRHAIKVMHAGVDEDTRGRMLAEGKIQARLLHPNVVRATDVVELPDGVALVMDRVEGETLRALLDRGAPARERAMALAEGILAGVGAAHGAGLIHRDLKPENVLIGADGVPKITDFGLARAEDPKLRGVRTQTGIGMGTPGYMAPEAYTDVASVDARADIFALGAILYELLTGQRAFPGGLPWFQQYQKACNTGYTPIHVHVPDLPAHLVRTVHTALDPDPGGRPASVDALVERWRGRAQAPTPSAPTVIVQVQAAASPKDAAPDVVPRHHLPAERDVFVGRGAEMASLDANIDQGARLITVLGIGGTGKTRFITRYGWSRLQGWPGGVWFCDLTEARSVDGVLSAVGGALDVPLGKDPVVQLGHAIAGRGRCLVILDNVEQVSAHASDMLGRWLDRAEQAVFVVTSRERLGLPGEQLLALDPLDEDAAVALFLARARAVKPDVSADRATLAALVRRLDHLPLAIELAAARVRILSPAAILARMSERFKLLASPSGRVSRHATLRAMLDWSWELLTPEERAGLAQLSVFAGGFTLEAAEAVLETGEAWPTDVVAALVDKSLVRRVSESRMDLLVSVAEYASERLDQLGLREVVEARHGAFFAAYGTEEAIDALDRHGGVALRRALYAELDNLVAASDRARARGEPEIAAATALAAGNILEMKGPFTVGAALLEAVSIVPGLSVSSRLRVLRGTGLLLGLIGRNEAVLSHYEAALAIAREVDMAGGERRYTGLVLGSLGGLYLNQSRRDEAHACYESALVIHRESARSSSDRRNEGLVLGNLGILHGDQGRMDEARAHYEAALAIHREAGARRREGLVLGNLGGLFLNQGQVDMARVHFDVALAIARELGDRRSEGIALSHLGVLYVVSGQMDEARVHYEVALAIAKDIGDRRKEGVILGNLGVLHMDQGRMEGARTHYETALAIHREVGNRLFEGHVLGNLGSLYLDHGRMEEARTHCEAALALHREFDDHRAEGVVLGHLGRLHARLKDPGTAAACLDAGEAILRRLADPLELGKLLCARAELEHTQHNLEAAAAALAEATTLAESAGAVPNSELGRRLTEVRALLRPA